MVLPVICTLTTLYGTICTWYQHKYCEGRVGESPTMTSNWIWITLNCNTHIQYCICVAGIVNSLCSTIDNRFFLSCCSAAGEGRWKLKLQFLCFYISSAVIAYCTVSSLLEQDEHLSSPALTGGDFLMSCSFLAACGTIYHIYSRYPACLAWAAVADRVKRSFCCSVSVVYFFLLHRLTVLVVVSNAPGFVPYRR